MSNEKQIGKNQNDIFKLSRRIKMVSDLPSLQFLYL